MSYDPYLEKSNRFSTNPVYNTVAITQPPSGLSGYHEVPTGSANQQSEDLETSQPATVVPSPDSQTQRQRPQNRWGDSICDWPKNLFPSCWCVVCCCYGMYLNAQISEKLGIAKFSTVIGVFLVIWILSFFLTLIIRGSVTIIWLPLICAFVYAIYLRLVITKKHDIIECGYNPILGEFCCAFWCWYCSVAQMARHVYGYNKVLDGDSNPFRPDNYAHTA